MLQLRQDLLLAHDVINLLHLDDRSFFQGLEGIMSAVALVGHKPAREEKTPHVSRLTRPNAPVPSVLPRLKSLTALVNQWPKDRSVASTHFKE